MRRHNQKALVFSFQRISVRVLVLICPANCFTVMSDDRGTLVGIPDFYARPFPASSAKSRCHHTKVKRSSTPFNWFDLN
jgi:hypothetical protein